LGFKKRRLVMKTFNEFKKNEREERMNLFEGKLPDFNEFNKAISEDSEYIDDILEAVGTASPEVRKTVEIVHGIQLEIQQLDKKMLDVREKFLAIPKEDTNKREPHRKELVDLNHKKLALQKSLQKAEMDFERALSKDEGDEDVDINLL